MVVRNPNITTARSHHLHHPHHRRRPYYPHHPYNMYTFSHLEMRHEGEERHDESRDHDDETDCQVHHAVGTPDNGAARPPL